MRLSMPCCSDTSERRARTIAQPKKTVVIVSADFAPSSYPQALRARFFARYLPDFGWKPIVLTVEPQYYEWAVDPENEKLLPADLEVVRTRAFPARLTRKFGIGDIGLRCLWQQWMALRRLCQREPVDLILVPIPPNPSMVLARLAYQEFGIPYVLDYNDPVTTNYYWKLPRSQRPPKYVLAYAMALLIEPFALRRVGELVSVDTSYTVEAQARYHGLGQLRTTAIPHGGEPADFEYLSLHPRKNTFFDKGDGLLHLGYVGRGGVDMISTLRALFRAVRLGQERNPKLFERLRMHFVGTTYAHNGGSQYQVLPTARSEGVESLIDEHPTRVSYLAAIQILLDCHALLMLGSESAHYTASKVFPYMLAKRPILAIFHQASSAVNILKDTHAGEVVTFGDLESLEARIPAITLQLENILNLPREFLPATRWDAFEPYTARAMTARLARVFDRVSGLGTELDSVTEEVAL